jgi:hypothetical protein
LEAIQKGDERRLLTPAKCVDEQGVFAQASQRGNRPPGAGLRQGWQ